LHALLKKEKKEGRPYCAGITVHANSGMQIEAARGLLDLGFREIHELNGRSPDALAAELLKLQNGTQNHYNQLPCFKLAVYFSENPEPKRTLLTPHAWKE
jgi:hypothetical protein